MTLFASTTVDALDAEIDALIEQILADFRTAPRCPECGGIQPAQETPMPAPDLKDDVAAIGRALRRGAGRLDLYATFDCGTGEFVAAMYAGEDVTEVALAREATLEDAFSTARQALGAAVRKAVSAP